MTDKENTEMEKWLKSAMQDSGVKIKESQLFAGIITENAVKDGLVALQLGLAIMMDKPIFLIVDKEVKISSAMRRVANGAIVRVDTKDPKAMEQASSQLNEFLKNNGAN